MQQNPFVLNAVDSIANQILFELRDRQIQLDRVRFRSNLKKLGELIAYEISKSLNYQPEEVETVLGRSSINVLTKHPVLITIMRAGLPFMEGFQHFFGNSECGFVGAKRIEEDDNIDASVEYVAVGSVEGKELIIADPMLATGKSLIATLDLILQRGVPKMLHLAFAIAAPEGLDHIKRTVKIPYKIWVGAIDERLNHQGYIVPGLGDAGDLLFGNKI